MVTAGSVKSQQVSSSLTSPTKMFRSSSGRTSPFQGEGHGFESRTEYKINWKVGEWLKPADCKSAPLRVRRFESVPSNNCAYSSVGQSIRLIIGRSQVQVLQVPPNIQVFIYDQQKSIFYLFLNSSIYIKYGIMKHFLM